MKALRSKILVLLGAVGLIGLDQLFKWLGGSVSLWCHNSSADRGRVPSDVCGEPRGGFWHSGWEGNFPDFTDGRSSHCIDCPAFYGKIPSSAFAYGNYTVLGGGIGNLIDRIFRHYVVDFLDFRLINFAVFNFADCCVVVGTILLFVYVLFFMDKNKKETDTVLKHESEDMQTHDGQAQS